MMIVKRIEICLCDLPPSSSIQSDQVKAIRKTMISFANPPADGLVHI